MAKRGAVGGLWAILMTWAVGTCGPIAMAEQPRTPGKLFISDVVITGNRRMSTEQIKKCLNSQPGKEYKTSVVDKDIRVLYKTNQFSKIITYLQKDGPGKVKICFTLDETPNKIEKVTFLGAKHLKTDELQNLTGVQSGMPIDPDLNHEGCEKIIAQYERMGRPSTRCELVKGGDSDDTEVVYQITEGPKVKIRDIRFTGKTFINQSDLSKRLDSSNTGLPRIGDTYVKKMVEAQVAAILKYYRAFGYLDVNVAAETERSSDGQEVTLIFHIQEGLRYRVTEKPEVTSVGSNAGESPKTKEKINSDYP